MVAKPPTRDGYTEEYKRFLETAKQVEASEDAEAFEKAFNKVLKPDKTPPKTGLSG